ncbi:MAG: hypothetical protein GY786_09185 [Proteobacteria bacterium]|nr:hypothetical protein [Pseudomonadota bacterium]
MDSARQSPKELKKILKELEPNSIRMKLIHSARQFKSNWVDFGEFLTNVATEKLYIPWGYKSFEEYCRIEVKIKKATAIKLTNAFFFISHEGEEFFEGHDNEGMPDLDAVCVLQRAKQDNSITPENYKILKDAAIDRGQTGQTLNRKYRGMVNLDSDNDSEEEVINQSRSLLAKLQHKLAALEDLPEQFPDYLQEIQLYLQSLESN